MNTTSTAKNFIDWFADVWAQPQPERFIERLSKDVQLTQPIRPPVTGHTAVIKEFSRLLETFPGLYGRVRQGMGDDQTVFIEWDMINQGPGIQFSVPVVDRFTLEGDMAIARAAYFNPLDMAGNAARSPLEAIRVILKLL